MKFRLFLVSVACILLVSCGGGSKKLAPDPTPLAAITSSVGIVLHRQFNIVGSGKNSDSAFLNLLPVLNGNRMIAASADGYVAAFDIRSGQQIWLSKVEGGITAGVGEQDGISVVVSGSRKVTAFHTDTGERRWEKDIDQTVFTPPLIYRDTVVLQTIDGDLIGLNASTGDTVWDAFFDQPEFVVFGSPRPIGFRNLVLVGNATGRIFATDLATGLEAWQIYLASDRSQNLLSDAKTIPVISDNSLFLSDYTKAVVAYDLVSGNLVWEHRRSSNRRLVVDETQIYGTDVDDRIFALTRNGGSQSWEQNALLHRRLSNVALIGDDHLVVGDEDGYLHVLDARSGRIVGRTRAQKDVVFGGFLVVGDNLFVAYRSGRIDAFSLRSVK